MELLAPGSMDIAIRLAYGGNWWSLSSRLRFLDDCAVGDSWATDGITVCFLEELRRKYGKWRSVQVRLSRKNRARRKILLQCLWKDLKDVERTAAARHCGGEVLKSNLHPGSAKVSGLHRINSCTVLPRAWRVALSAALGNWGFCCVAPASLHTQKPE